MRLVAYLRVSTDEQAESGAGLKAQADACRRHADRDDKPLVGPFVDEGISGAAGLDKRPGLMDALAALEPGDTLLVAKRDRLGRDPLVIALIEATVERKGCRIVSAAGEGTDGDDPNNILMRRMVDAFGEYERLIIKSRTRAALAAKKRRGERVGSVPLGSRLAEDGRMLETDHDELATLATIRRLAAEGLNPRQIAGELDRRGIPTKRGGTGWAHSTVRKVLSLPAHPEPTEPAVEPRAEPDREPPPDPLPLACPA